MNVPNNNQASTTESPDVYRDVLRDHFDTLVNDRATTMLAMSIQHNMNGEDDIDRFLNQQRYLKRASYEGADLQKAILSPIADSGRGEYASQIICHQVTRVVNDPSMSGSDYRNIKTYADVARGNLTFMPHDDLVRDVSRYHSMSGRPLMEALGDMMKNTVPYLSAVIEHEHYLGRDLKSKLQNAFADPEIVKNVKEYGVEKVLLSVTLDQPIHSSAEDFQAAIDARHQASIEANTKIIQATASRLLGEEINVSKGASYESATAHNRPTLGAAHSSAPGSVQIAKSASAMAPSLASRVMSGVRSMASRLFGSAERKSDNIAEESQPSAIKPQTEALSVKAKLIDIGPELEGVVGRSANRGLHTIADRSVSMDSPSIKEARVPDRDVEKDRQRDMAPEFSPRQYPTPSYGGPSM